MTRYMVYFEPREIDADNLEDAERKYRRAVFDQKWIPKVLKIVPAEFVYDIDQEKKIT